VDDLVSESTAELFFWQLMDSLPDNVYFKDTRSRFTCINRAQARFLGVNEPNDVIGKSDFDYFEAANAAERFKDEQARGLAQWPTLWR
jgi:hypothetical protein